MQVRKIISRDSSESRVQLFPKAFGEHLRKRLDTPAVASRCGQLARTCPRPIYSLCVRLSVRLLG